MSKGNTGIGRTALPTHIQAENRAISSAVSDGMLHYNTAEGNIRYLLGKVLTIVDATIPLEDQKKAAKDLVRDAFRETIHTMQVNCFGTNQLQPINIEPLR